jgi:hypothetical protein
MFIRAKDGRAWDVNSNLSIMDDGNFLDSVMKPHIYVEKNVLDFCYSDRPSQALIRSQDLECLITTV